MDLSRTWGYKDLGDLKTENKKFIDLYRKVSNIVNVNEYDNDRYSHACVVRRLVEEDIIKPENILQIGIRVATEEQMEFARKNNIKMITSNEIYNRIKFRTNFEKAYLSFDLDILDPAYAQEIGNPEPGGLSTRELVEIIMI